MHTDNLELQPQISCILAGEKDKREKKMVESIFIQSFLQAQDWYNPTRKNLVKKVTGGLHAWTRSFWLLKHQKEAYKQCQINQEEYTDTAQTHR